MKDNKDDLEEKEIESDRVDIENKSIFDKFKEYQKEEKLEKLKYESDMTKKIAEESQKEREIYEKQLQGEKLELMKIKEGDLEVENSSFHTEEITVEMSFRKKISNFFYHNKWWLGLATFFTVIIVLCVYDYATKVTPDIVAIILEHDEELGQNTEIIDYINQFNEDFNDDDKIAADVYYIAYSGNEQVDYSNGTTTKLVAQLQSDESMIIFGGGNIDDVITPEDILVNLEELYPDNPHIKGYGFYLKDTDFAEKINYQGEMDEQMFIGIRKPQKLTWASEKEMQKAYDKSIVVLERIIEDLS